MKPLEGGEPMQTHKEHTMIKGLENIKAELAKSAEKKVANHMANIDQKKEEKKMERKANNMVKKTMRETTDDRILAEAFVEADKELATELFADRKERTFWFKTYRAEEFNYASMYEEVKERLLAPKEEKDSFIPEIDANYMTGEINPETVDVEVAASMTIADGNGGARRVGSDQTLTVKLADQIEEELMLARDGFLADYNSYVEKMTKNMYTLLLKDNYETKNGASIEEQYWVRGDYILKCQLKLDRENLSYTIGEPNFNGMKGLRIAYYRMVDDIYNLRKLIENSTEFTDEEVEENLEMEEFLNKEANSIKIAHNRHMCVSGGLNKDLWAVAIMSAQTHSKGTTIEHMGNGRYRIAYFSADGASGVFLYDGFVTGTWTKEARTAGLSDREVLDRIRERMALRK